MKPKFKYQFMFVLCFGILATCLMIKPATAYAAGAGNEPEGILTLTKDTIYEYDLNGDGTTEKLQYQLSGDEDQYKAILKVYINDKLCLTKEDDGFSFGVRLLDLDQNDNSLDLFLYTTMESDCVKNAFFARYNGEKLAKYADFDIEKLAKDFNTYRYSLAQLDGDGKFTIVIDTPKYSPAIGCYYCYMPFQLKDGKVTVIPVKTYTLTKESGKYLYKAAKLFNVYEKAGSKKVVYQVKKGARVTFDKMAISKSGKVYCRVKNSKGKTGWIKSDQEYLFVTTPAWG